MNGTQCVYIYKILFHNTTMFEFPFLKLANKSLEGIIISVLLLLFIIIAWIDQAFFTVSLPILVILAPVIFIVLIIMNNQFREISCLDIKKHKLEVIQKWMNIGILFHVFIPTIVFILDNHITFNNLTTIYIKLIGYTIVSALLLNSINIIIYSILKKTVTLTLLYFVFSIGTASLTAICTFYDNFSTVIITLGIFFKGLIIMSSVINLKNANEYATLYKTYAGDDEIHKNRQEVCRHWLILLFLGTLATTILLTIRSYFFDAKLDPINNYTLRYLPLLITICLILAAELWFYIKPLTQCKSFNKQQVGIYSQFDHFARNAVNNKPIRLRF